MFSWWSFYDRWWRNGFQCSVACCKMCVGIYGYVFSCMALNGLATQGSQLFGHLPGTGNS
jgi:hypothetical protein